MIWVTGSSGMLGRSLCESLGALDCDFTATDTDVDITDRNEVERFVRDRDLRWIINCAAYTAVDRAEDEPDRKSTRLNSSHYS